MKVVMVVESRETNEWNHSSREKGTKIVVVGASMPHRGVIFYTPATVSVAKETYMDKVFVESFLCGDANPFQTFLI